MEMFNTFWKRINLPLFIIGVCLMISCKQNEKNCEVSFDEVVYYYSTIDEDILFESSYQRPLTPEKIFKMEIISGKIPASVDDTSFLQKLPNIGYSKKMIQKDKFDDISEIFCEMEYSSGYETKCEPVYRDILVFKYQSKIISIAKICIECEKNWIVELEKNGMALENRDEYETLEKILKE